MDLYDHDPAELLIHAPATLEPRTLQFDPPLSDGELLRFCELNDIFRVERRKDGAIAMRALPGMGASGANVVICCELGTWWETHKRGRCLMHAGYLLPDGSMRGPATSYLTEKTAARLTEEDRNGFARVCPDFAVELIGYGDTLPEAKHVMGRWLKNGLPLGWLFDPHARRVFIYQAGSAEPVEVHGNTIEGTGPVAGFRLNLDQVWERYSP